MSELMMSDLYTVNASYPLDSIHMRSIQLLYQLFNCLILHCVILNIYLSS